MTALELIMELNKVDPNKVVVIRYSEAFNEYMKEIPVHFVSEMESENKIILSEE